MRGVSPLAVDCDAGSIYLLGLRWRALPSSGVRQVYLVGGRVHIVPRPLERVRAEGAQRLELGLDLWRRGVDVACHLTLSVDGHRAIARALAEISRGAPVRRRPAVAAALAVVVVSGKIYSLY